MQLIAHRGESAHFPENTLAAFDAALSTADALELDLGLTRDGEIVVLHDETLDRTTNGSGRLADCDWAEIARLDAGSWFGEAFASERVPRIDQVLELYRGRIDLNLELKAEAFAEPASIADPLGKLLALLGRDTRGILVSSFDWRILRDLSRRRPGLKIGVLQDGGELARALEAARAVEAASIHLERTLVDDDAVARVHADNRKLLVYTVDEREELRRLRSLGVDGVFTNSTRSAAQSLASFS
ncbi:MAG: glycerophosphodiester phosphodiesterase family protein [Acidobacteriota bacterium]